MCVNFGNRCLRDDIPTVCFLIVIRNYCIVETRHFGITCLITIQNIDGNNRWGWVTTDDVQIMKILLGLRMIGDDKYHPKYFSMVLPYGHFVFKI